MTKRATLQKTTLSFLSYTPEIQKTYVRMDTTGMDKWWKKHKVG